MNETTEEINIIVGRKIASLLKLNRMSQSELARRVGYSSHASISRILKGTLGPGKVMMKKIADELKVPEFFLSSSDEYTNEEWLAIQKIHKVFTEKNENKSDYNLLLDFLKKI